MGVVWGIRAISWVSAWALDPPGQWNLNLIWKATRSYCRFLNTEGHKASISSEKLVWCECMHGEMEGDQAVQLEARSESQSHPEGIK